MLSRDALSKLIFISFYSLFSPHLASSVLSEGRSPQLIDYVQNLPLNFQHLALEINNENCNPRPPQDVRYLRACLLALNAGLRRLDSTLILVPKEMVTNANWVSEKIEDIEDVSLVRVGPNFRVEEESSSAEVRDRLRSYLGLWSEFNSGRFKLPAEKILSFIKLANAEVKLEENILAWELLSVFLKSGADPHQYPRPYAMVKRGQSFRSTMEDQDDGSVRKNESTGKILTYANTNTAYIKISNISFNGNQDFLDVFSRLQSKSSSPVSTLIIDLRDNTGGLLPQAAAIAGNFIPYGRPLVQLLPDMLKPGESQPEPLVSTSKDLIKMPVVVMVNERTGSAAEALAALLKLNGALLVGNTTFGKFTVQQLSPEYYLIPSILKARTTGEIRIIQDPEAPNPSANISLQAEGLKPDIVAFTDSKQTKESPFILREENLINARQHKGDHFPKIENANLPLVKSCVVQRRAERELSGSNVGDLLVVNDGAIQAALDALTCLPLPQKTF